MPTLLRAMMQAVVVAMALASASFGAAQGVAPQPAPPPEVRELMRLIDDPAVRVWLQANPPAAAAPAVAPPVPDNTTLAGEVSQRLFGIRAHLAALAAAIPRVPSEARATLARVMGELQQHSFFRLLALVLAFGVLGYGAELAYARATRGGWHPLARAAGTSLSGRTRWHGMRLAFGLGRVLAFALGSMGAFLLFEWPLLLKVTVLVVLMAVVATRLARALGIFLLAPETSGNPVARLLPMSDGEARFWFARLVAFVAWFSIGYGIVDLMRTYDVSPEVAQLAAYALGLGLLGIAVEATWRRPQAGALAPGRASNALMTVYLVGLWCLWVAGARGLFWIGVYAGFLPWGVRAVGAFARGITGRDEVTHSDVSPYSIMMERGLRALLLVVAALWLAHILGLDLDRLGTDQDLAMRVTRGALASFVIVLLADFVWQLAKAEIERRLVASASSEGSTPEETARRGRLHTLLPILRNVLLVVVTVTAALMVLSSLGIEIGPLVAGAGIVGVAIGFGSQTLVKDIISGVFYLLDDAFRIGEYIQSGSYKGTVESFSLRSVKLRHHRGPIYTIPFGDLGAVQNMSRDWVIDKFIVRVIYDTDIAKVKKLVKAIGRELQEDPEFGLNILETLKMQGVEQFGEFAIELRFKMMTRPGQQFSIRRRAFAMIKQAFDENGIRFALPTVQVAGAAQAPDAAIAKAGRDLIAAPAAQ